MIIAACDSQNGTRNSDEFKAALELFTDMFGIRHLRSYVRTPFSVAFSVLTLHGQVGDITFFEQLSTITVEPNTYDQGIVTELFSKLISHP